MTDSTKKFSSIAEVRSAYYPESAAMIALDQKELVGFPHGLASESLEVIGEILGDTAPTASVGASTRKTALRATEGTPDCRRKAKGSRRKGT